MMSLTAAQISELTAQFFLAAAGTLSFAILFACPRRCLPYCALVGAVGWLWYELLTLMEYGLDDRGKEVQAKFWGTEEQRKRWLKVKYIKAPLFLRPFINFNIRYILKGGFLDGKEGFIWHFLQGFWYRFLVDAKIYEIKKRFGWNDKRIKAFIKETYLDK